MQRQPCPEPIGVGSGIGRVALDDHVEVVDCGFQSERGEKVVDAAHGLGWRSGHPAGFAVHLCRWNPELKMIRRGSRMLWNPPITHLSVDRRRSRVHGSGVCGGNIDARNGAQPVRLAFGSDLAGAEVFIPANADTVSRPNAALITEFYPDVEVRGDLGEHETLLSIDKASRPLGYRTRTGGARPPPPVCGASCSRPGVGPHPNTAGAVRPPAS
jgi:hypothetical protein